MSTKTVRSSSADETVRFGEWIGGNVHGGTLLLLRGPIGGGKSVLVRGVAAALGIENFLGSPTFNLVHEYTSGRPFYHVDLYRLGEIESEELGLEEYVRPDSVVAVEWADRAPEYLTDIAADYVLWIDLEILGPEERLITVTAGTDASRPHRSSDA